METRKKQDLLDYLGYDLRNDGIDGPKTRAALSQFQSDYAIPDGQPDDVVARCLVAAVSGMMDKPDTSTTDTTAEQTETTGQAETQGELSQYLKSDGYYHIPKDKDVKLSKNFSSREFRCGLGSPCSACSETLINPKLVSILQDIREHFGSSITITSGYRCPSYNKSIGGATGSRHSKGDAADIVVSQHTPRTVARYAEDIGVLGIGLYETQSDGFFVHIDTREAKSFWYGQGQAYRSTFK